MTNHDYIIDKIFFDNDNLNKSSINRYNLRKKKLYRNLYNYILHRYNDSESERETLYRIHYHVEYKPMCPVCNKPLKFNGRNNTIFLSHCSNKCKKLDKIVNEKWKKSCGENGTNRERAKQTMINKYGVSNPFQITEVIEHISQINKEKLQESLEKRKHTCQLKYGVDSYMQTEQFTNQREQTSLQRYGTIYPIQSDIVKEKYNWSNIISKINNTKYKNHTFNTSKSEDQSYALLTEKYPDVVRQHKSDRYPFVCDFYIPSLDLYIECNYHWTHGGKPYEGTKDDIDKVQKWKDKNTKYYDNAIQTWTVRDVEKRRIAKDNNLNSIEVFNIKDLLYKINIGWN